MVSNAGNRCINCGQPFRPGTVFCGNCGNPTTNIDNNATARAQQGAGGNEDFYNQNTIQANPTPPLPISGMNYSLSSPNYQSSIQPPPPPLPPLSSSAQPSFMNGPGNSGIQQPQQPFSGDNFQPPIPPRKSFWNAKHIFITFAIVLLVLLIGGGTLFAYAYNVGQNSNKTAQTTHGQTPIATTASQTTPTTAAQTTPTTAPQATSTPSGSPTAGVTATGTAPVVATATPGTTTKNKTLDCGGCNQPVLVTINTITITSTKMTWSLTLQSNSGSGQNFSYNFTLQDATGSNNYPATGDNGAGVAVGQKIQQIITFSFVPNQNVPYTLKANAYANGAAINYTPLQFTF